MSQFALVRKAVRQLLDQAAGQGLLHDRRVAVAVSGGADSLALAAAVPADLVRHGLIVDHHLQAGSSEIAAQAAKQLHGMDFDEVRVLSVDVGTCGGPEAAARKARYRALRDAADGTLVLLGHTRDDQAETVLLGLGRGSGPRSIAGMRPLDPPWGRPLLTVPRTATVAACAELNLTPWTDPHNADPAFVRVRLRHEVLPLLEDVLQGGVAPALARTAAQLREDAEALDLLAAKIPISDELDVELLAGEPPALRRRVLRRWLLAAGVLELTDAHLRSVDALIGEWRGQGGVWLPGGLEVSRARGRLTVSG